MILGTHDTMSGHKPYHWYMYPLWIFGKCQKYDIYTQIVMGCEV